MSVHLVLGMAIVALGVATALMGLAVLAGRMDGTKVQRAVRTGTTEAQRSMALRVIHGGQAAPVDEVALVREVARGQVSQGAFVITSSVVITLLLLSAVGTGSPSWLQVTSPVVGLVNVGIAVVIALRVRRARRFLAAGPEVRRAASR